jgi:carboxyl-terminal processing protease
MRKKKVKKEKDSLLEKKSGIFNELGFDLDGDSKFSIFEVIIVTFISIIFGIIVGYILTYTSTSIKAIKSDHNLEEIISTYNTLKDNYYDDVDEDSLADNAIKGMVSSLDDSYSSFMDNKTTESFNESVDGYFVGIGVTIMYSDEYNQIIKVDEDGPGDKAGLKVNDIILSVDGKSVKGVYGEELTSLIKGKSGTKVKIKIKRGDTTKNITVKRGIIEIENVTSHLLEENGKKIGYINVDIFASNTYKQFKKNLNRMEKKKAESLIIDLRDNPGGHLSQTRDILSMFFDKKTVLYELKNKNKVSKIYSSSNEKRNYPIVILVNGNSASASEVMASCFKDNYKNVTVVGTKTYGKGTVQQTIKLSSGTSFKYTTEKWLTSKGKSIDGVGLNPDINVELEQSYYSNPIYENDLQIQKAVEILK